MSKSIQTSSEVKSNRKMWIIFSFSFTALILGWAFSLPFRSSESPLVAVQGDGSQQTLVFDPSETETEVSPQSADEFRAAAIALEKAYARKRKEKNQLKQVPGKVEVRLQWNRHVESVKRQLSELGSPEKGTWEWQQQQELLESLNDGPL